MYISKFSLITAVAVAPRQMGRVDGSRFQLLRRIARGVREVFISYHHLPAAIHNMLMSRFFLEQRVSHTRGGFSSTLSSRPSRRSDSSTVVAKTTSSASVGKRSSSITHTVAIGCCHVLLTDIDEDVSR